MSDRRNRQVMVVVSLILLVGGGLAVLQGAAVFGDQRSTAHIFSPTVVRWWREGGWMSFAVVGGIGGVAVLLGLLLVSRELRRNDGRHRTSEVRFDVDGVRGRRHSEPLLCRMLSRRTSNASRTSDRRWSVFSVTCQKSSYEYSLKSAIT